MNQMSTAIGEGRIEWTKSTLCWWKCAMIGPQPDGCKVIKIEVNFKLHKLTMQRKVVG